MGRPRIPALASRRLPPSQISVLQRLLQDSEVDLFDGTRLVSWPRYLQLVREMGDDARLVATGRPAGEQDDTPEGALARSLGAAPGVVEVASSGRRLAGVHPAFRAIALANPPSAEHRWLQSETLPLLSYHVVPGLPGREARGVLGSRFPGAPGDVLDAMVRFQELVEHQVHSGAADGVLTQAQTLSTRHLIRLARHAVRMAPPSAAAPTLPRPTPPPPPPFTERVPGGLSARPPRPPPRRPALPVPAARRPAAAG